MKATIPPMDRFRKSVMVDEETGCHRWLKETMQFFDSSRKGRWAARWIWEQVNGEVPEKHHLRRTCADKYCVNPAHFEVTEKVPPLAAVHRTRTHCKQGHALTPDNIVMRGRAGYPLYRSCRTCRRETERLRKKLRRIEEEQRKARRSGIARSAALGNTLKQVTSCMPQVAIVRTSPKCLVKDNSA